MMNLFIKYVSNYLGINVRLYAYVHAAIIITRSHAMTVVE